MRHAYLSREGKEPPGRAAAAARTQHPVLPPLLLLPAAPPPAPSLPLPRPAHRQARGVGGGQALRHLDGLVAEQGAVNQAQTHSRISQVRRAVDGGAHLCRGMQEAPVGMGLA